MITYEEARDKGLSVKESQIVERLSHDGVLCKDGGLHAEYAGLSYDSWRRLCGS